jgi:ATP-dependent RNA helicase DeaD
MTEFEGVVPALGQALSKRGYTDLTPVQKAILAPEVHGADALVSAQTGSGKTVAFGMTLAPTLLDGAERFSHAPVPLALVVAPTRELALQVKRELEWLYALTGASISSCVGGMDMRTERRELQRGVHIVVGTPGRLRDHIERGSFNTTGLKAIVLDEADEMLDLGFRDDLEYILDAAPADRRTLMFSATVPRAIARLAQRYQRDAVRVSTAAEQSQHVDIEYRAMTVAPNDRENAIVNVLRFFDPKSALVFCGTRATVNHMTARFNNRGFSVVALSGELSQNERTHALQAMRDGRARVCICTDVAARGIDLPNLELVVHADLPKSRETLLHRSGRTGRAGRKGTCVLIVPHNWRSRTERLLNSAKIKASWGKPPSVDEIKKRDRERILLDPTLSEALNDEEQAFAKELLAQHSPEQIAAAFLRLHSAGQSAPEELIDAAPLERQESRREDFKNGLWFSLSVGREQNAEPRWLLPMLCRAGHLTKREIGSIKIQNNETYVELDPSCIERFLEAVGPGLTMEKNVTITAMDGAPPATRGHSRNKPYDKKKPFRDKKPYKSDKPDARDRSGPKPKFAQKPEFNRKPDGAAGEDAPRDKSWAKPKGKKPYKAKFDKPKYDKTKADRPKADRPKFDKPKFDKPKSGKPKATAKPGEKYAPKPAKPANKDRRQLKLGFSPLKRKRPAQNAD